MNEILLDIYCDSPKLTNIPAFSNDLCSKSKINTVNLLKTIQKLKLEVSNLQSELVKKCQEIEVNIFLIYSPAFFCFIGRNGFFMVYISG